MRAEYFSQTDAARGDLYLSRRVLVMMPEVVKQGHVSWDKKPLYV